MHGPQRLLPNFRESSDLSHFDASSSFTSHHALQTYKASLSQACAVVCTSLRSLLHRRRPWIAWSKRLFDYIEIERTISDRHKVSWIWPEIMVSRGGRSKGCSSCRRRRVKCGMYDLSSRVNPTPRSPSRDYPT
jgi:hypothetical protein